MKGVASKKTTTTKTYPIQDYSAKTFNDTLSENKMAKLDTLFLTRLDYHLVSVI